MKKYMNTKTQELSEKELDNVSGGVQAGFFVDTGVKEFGDQQEQEKTDAEKRLDLFLHAEGKTYL